MHTYYFTFPCVHLLHDRWVEIMAENSELAREKMVENFGIKWAFQYEDVDWKPENFPGGRLGRVLEAI